MHKPRTLGLAFLLVMSACGGGFDVVIDYVEDASAGLLAALSKA